MEKELNRVDGEGKGVGMTDKQRDIVDDQDQ